MKIKTLEDFENVEKHELYVNEWGQIERNYVARAPEYVLVEDYEELLSFAKKLDERVKMLEAAFSQNGG